MNGAGSPLLTVEGRALPLQTVTITVTAAGGIAEVSLEQRFRNTEGDPVDVIYTFALPFDAAVSAYAFTCGNRRVIGQVERRALAREHFEEALLEGRTASLLEQDRSSLFRQELGRIPPGEDVVVTMTLEQRLRWLDEGAWEWRFPTAAAPRYQGDDGRRAEPGGDIHEVADGPLAVRARMTLTIQDVNGGPAESPSHRLRANATGAIELDATGGVELDRDVVVRWPVRRPLGDDLSLELARPPAGAPHGEAAHGLLTIVPPAAPSRPDPVARDLVVLLDTSGSMADEPLRQARRLVAALVDSLGDADQLELIEFSREARRWREGPVAATAAMKRAALSWVASLRADGGTEMRQGIEEALRPLRPDSQRQVVLITDGLIGAESRVVRSIAHGLPASSRLHTVGVGSAVNRSLTGAAARAGRGAEVVLGLGEDVERAARRLVARTATPLVVDLTIQGPALYTHAPQRLPDLFAGAPVLVGLALRPEGGTLTAEGRTARGPWRQTVKVLPAAPGSGRPLVSHLLARERIEDLEARITAGEAVGPLEREIERLGLEFQLATRLTSWVAISEESSTEPGRPGVRIRIPQQLPAGMSVESLGLRRAGGGALSAAARVADHPGALATRPFGLPIVLSQRPPSMAPPAPVTSRISPPPPPTDAVTIVPGFIPPQAQTGMAAPLAAGWGAGAPPSRTAGASAGVTIRLAAADEWIGRGRSAPHEGGGLAITFAVEDDQLAWRIGHEVELIGPDGQRAAASVLQCRPPGTVGAGEQVELWVALPAGMNWPVREVVISGGPRLLIVVL